MGTWLAITGLIWLGIGTGGGSWPMQWWTCYVLRNDYAL